MIFKSENRTVKTRLNTPFPNPTNAVTIISYYLFEDAEVSLDITNLLGQTVYTFLRQDKQSSGEYHLSWNCKNNKGQKVQSGSYLIVLEVDGIRYVQKATLMY